MKIVQQKVCFMFQRGTKGPATRSDDEEERARQAVCIRQPQVQETTHLRVETDEVSDRVCVETGEFCS